MWSLFHSVTNRLKALFVADLAQDFEAQLLEREIERKAELLRQAQRYEAEGLCAIAQHLRRRAEALSTDKPLATVLPAITHLQADPDTTQESCVPMVPPNLESKPPRKRKGERRDRHDP